jgi:hypothetical protein
MPFPTGHCMVNEKWKELKMINIAETSERDYRSKLPPCSTGWQLGPKENIHKNYSYGKTD